MTHPTSPQPSTLLTHVRGDVLTLTLNRPQARNALHAPLIAALTEQFLGLPQTVRTVVLCGAGVSFCSGADLSWMRSPNPLSQTEQHAPNEQAVALQQLFAAMAQASQVVVAVAQGPVRGGGVGLLCAADIVVAGTSFTLAFPEASLGLVPAVIAPYVVERMGMAKARHLFLTSEVVPAQEAQALGVVHELVADSALPERLAHVLARLHHNGPEALAATKRLLRAMGTNNDPAVHALCARTLQEVRARPEAQEGCAAFLQRRAPSWRQT